MSLEQQLLAEDDVAKNYEETLAVLHSISVASTYQSEDSASLIDIAIRQREMAGPLITVNDEMATFYYHMHSRITPFFSRVVTRNTPSRAERLLSQDESLFAMFRNVYPNASSHVLKGKYGFLMKFGNL